MQLMKRAAGKIVSLTIGLLWLGVGAPLWAQSVLFDNTVHDLGTRFNPGSYQVGDQITLAGTGNLLYFSFEWYGINTIHPDSFSGAIQAQVRMYYNNGTLFNGYAAPGTMFFNETYLFSDVGATPTPRSTEEFFAGLDFPSGGLPITSPDITWSVQFTGLGAGDEVGLDLYSPPAVGAEVGDFGDYWQNAGSGWTLNTNTVAMDFGAYMAAPEPSSMTLSLVGGLGILFASRWFRRKE